MMERQKKIAIICTDKPLFLCYLFKILLSLQYERSIEEYSFRTCKVVSHQFLIPGNQGEEYEDLRLGTKRRTDTSEEGDVCCQPGTKWHTTVFRTDSKSSLYPFVCLHVICTSLLWTHS